MKWIILMAMVAICVGCGDHKKTERNVMIEVLLKDGGSIVLNCPKFNSAPWGSHGRKCHIDNYTEE